MVMVSAMLGRVHLSGRPDLLTPGRAAVVRRAVDVYKTTATCCRTPNRTGRWACPAGATAGSPWH